MTWWPAPRVAAHPPQPRGRQCPPEDAAMSPELAALLDRLRQEAPDIPQLTASELDRLAAYLDSLPPPPPSPPVVIGSFSAEVIRRIPRSIPDPAAEARAWRFHLNHVRRLNERWL